MEEMITYSQLIKEKKDAKGHGSEKHAVMAFGRMNPPTAGHEEVVKKMHEVAKEHGAEHHLVLSHSEDKKKNPLPVDKKVEHAKNAFPGTNVRGASKDKPTILHHAADLHKAGVQHLHVVAGSDRHQAMHDLLHKYNDGKEHAHGSFKFKSITLHSSGERDPDSEGTAGVSGTKMREHASSGNKKDFHANLPKSMKPEHKDALYHDLRHHMGVKEEVELDELIEGDSFLSTLFSRRKRGEQLSATEHEQLKIHLHRKKSMRESTTETKTGRIHTKDNWEGYPSTFKKKKDDSKLMSPQDRHRMNRIIPPNDKLKEEVIDEMLSANAKVVDTAKIKSSFHKPGTGVNSDVARKILDRMSQKKKKTGGWFHKEETEEQNMDRMKQIKNFKQMILDLQLQEVLSKDASAGDWIHDFVHSDNPKFAGKSKEKRKQMALAAYYAKQRNEEVEQIDELSRDILLSYANKVSLDSQKHSKDPTKRSGEKASRSVTGYARAHNRLEKPVKEGVIQPSGTDKIETSGSPVSDIGNQNLKVKKVKSFKFFTTEEAKTGNPGFGYHGQHKSENDADKAYAKIHAHVKSLTDGDDKTVKHYLDSAHGRHLVGHEEDHEHIKKDFKKFKKHYRPEMHEDVELSEAGGAGDSLGHLTAAERAREIARRKAKIASNTTPANKKFVEKALSGKIKEECEEVDLTEGVHPSEVAGNPRMYSADTVKKAYYHKKASAGDKESLARHLDRYHGNKEWRKPVKEEAEQIDELSKSTLGSYVKSAARDVGASRKLATDFEHSAQSARKQSAKDANTRLADRFKATAMKRHAGIGKAVERLTKEEVELEEAFINGREYASHGLMHPDHAKWQSHRVGVHTDFYAHGTGDKINGQVMKNDGKEVHIKATKTSGGKLHKFKVQRDLPKQQNEAVKPVNIDKVNAAGDKPHEEKWEPAKKKMKKESLSFSDFLKQLDEKLIGKQKKLDKNHNNKLDSQDFKLLRKEETEALDEIKMADLPGRVVKGRSYGADYEDPEGAFETKDDMKKSEPKKAGRKAGQKVGARANLGNSKLHRA